MRQWKAAWITAGDRLKDKHYHIALDVIEWIPGADGKTVGAIVVENHISGKQAVRQFWPGRQDEEELTLDYGFYEDGGGFVDEEGMKAEWEKLQAAFNKKFPVKR